MAWQAYVDNNLVASGVVTSAGIYDLNGNPWAYSPGFAAQISEVAAISKAMATESGASELSTSGFRIAGIKYFLVKCDKLETIGKKGATGVVVHKCNSCVIVAYHADNIQPGACNEVTGKLADFLRENNF